MTHRFLVLAAWCIAVPGAVWAAPQSPPGSSLDLAALQAAAVEHDPRGREIELEAGAAALRLENIEADRLPAIVVEGRGQYQSDVPQAPFLTPSGAPVFSPAKDTYDASVRMDAPLLDPTVEPRLAAERARRDEAQARVRAALYQLRQEVNEAFFTAALTGERRNAVQSAIADLESRLEETTVRVREGAAIPAEAAAIEAALLERRQDLAEIGARRRAALSRLEDLTGRAVRDDDVLPMPDLGALVARARDQMDALRARPEYEHFAKTSEALSRQQDVAAARDRPRLSAFATAGYGRPGLNPLDDRFEGYWLAGMQLRWTPWDRGTSARDQETLSLQRSIVAAEEAAFTERLRRDVENGLADIDRLSATDELDERLVTLREEVVRSTRVQLQEGAVTGSDYVDRNTDLLNAQVARATHRIELAQAGARVLTLLGLEVQ